MHAAPVLSVSPYFFINCFEIEQFTMLFCKKIPFYKVLSFTIAKNIYSFRPFFHFLDNKKSYLYSYRLFCKSWLMPHAAGPYRKINANCLLQILAFSVRRQPESWAPLLKIYENMMKSPEKYSIIYLSRSVSANGHSFITNEEEHINDLFQK